MQELPSWEYRIVELPADRGDAAELVAEAGAEGWRVAAVLPAEQNARPALLLERPRPSEPLEASAPAGDEDAAPPLEPAEPAAPSFDVVLTGIALDRPSVVVAIAQLCPWLHLKEAKRLVETPPATLARRLAPQDALDLQARLLAAGATVIVVDA